jgi:hypothetical protein
VYLESNMVNVPLSKTELTLLIDIVGVMRGTSQFAADVRKALYIDDYTLNGVRYTLKKYSNNPSE